MKQEKIWMRYLIIVIISFSLLSINSSCSQEDKDCLVMSEFVFINNSDFSLDTPIGIILPNNELIKKYDDIGSCESKANDFLPPFRDVLIIKLNGMCKIYSSNSPIEGEGPLSITNYIAEKVSDNNFKFTYSFENSEFENLEICE